VFAQRLDLTEMPGARAKRARQGGRLLEVALSAAVLLVVAGACIAAYDENQAERQRLDATAVEARLLAGALATPLIMNDPDMARQRMRAVESGAETQAIAVYRPDGALMAEWTRPGAQSASAAIANPMPGVLTLTQPIVQDGRPLGSVRLRTVGEPLLRRLTRYGAIGLLMLMAAVLVAGLAASNAALVAAHRRLRRAMVDRAKAETALREAQKQQSALDMESMRERGMTAFRRYAAHMEFALAAGQLGGWSRDLRSNRFTASALFRAHHGFDPEGPWLGPTDVLGRIHPEDRTDHVSRVNAAIAESSVLETEYRTLMPDGTTRWVLMLGRADYDESGEAIRLAGVSMDVSARKAADERQRLLLDELNHRVKNTLASVQSIALQTGRTAETAEQFETAFLARINALARVHDLLAKVAWEEASLADILAQTLAPYEGRALGGRAGFSGPPVKLGPNAAVTLAMAFHELATNAAKYGALSNDRGRIEIGWRIEHVAAGELLEIDWAEHGGPPVGPPKRRGFGSQFLQRALAREFDGQVNLRFTAPGLNCRMRLPLSAKLRLAA
jgi:two-component sensor histidine kinase